MQTLTKDLQDNITPNQAVELLKQGNQRFVDNMRFNRNLLQQVDETAASQFPFATVLSCIDSRAPAELVFDQGIGDIFNVRIAGNIVNEDILGSMEFATKVAGSKLILVLGHTSCGAIKGACDHVEMGNLTGLLEKVKPAIESEQSFSEDRNGSNLPFVDAVAKLNILQSIDTILKSSQVIADLVAEKKIKVIGGLYDIKTGTVSFFEK